MAATRRQSVRRTSEAAQWADRLPPEYLLCRDLGHTWNPYRAWYDRPGKCYVQVLQCPRCHAERTRELDAAGRRLAQSYSYDEGYLAPAGSGVLSQEGRADLRLASLMRLVDEEETMPDEVAARRARRAKQAS